MFIHAKIVSGGTPKKGGPWREVGDPKASSGFVLKFRTVTLPSLHGNIRVARKPAYLGRKEVQENIHVKEEWKEGCHVLGMQNHCLSGREEGGESGLLNKRR